MKCPTWSESTDDFQGRERVELLEHLRTCKACRARAATDDASLLFSALSPRRVDSSEIEAMKMAVHNLRRVQHLQSPVSRQTWRRFVGLAAVLMVGLLLAPERRVAVPPVSVPFSGALGIGSGTLALEANSTSTANSGGPVSGRIQIDYQLLSADWRIEEIADQIDDAKSIESLAGKRTEVLASGTLEVPSAGPVERHLEDKYRISFEMVSLAAPDRFALRGFDLTQRRGSGEEALVQADLLLGTRQPLLLKLHGPDSEGHSLILILQATSPAGDRS